MHEAGSSKVPLIQFINSESPCHRVCQKSFQQNDSVRLRAATSDIVTMTQSVHPPLRIPNLNTVWFSTVLVFRARASPCKHDVSTGLP